LKASLAARGPILELADTPADATVSMAVRIDIDIAIVQKRVTT
jgi:hypothetical protein